MQLNRVVGGNSHREKHLPFALSYHCCPNYEMVLTVMLMHYNVEFFSDVPNFAPLLQFRMNIARKSQIENFINKSCRVFLHDLYFFLPQPNDHFSQPCVERNSRLMHHE